MEKRRYAPGKRARRDEAGYWLCVWCEGRIYRPGSRRFCRAECRHEHLIRTSPAYQHKAVFARDRGVCALCDLDTVAKAEALTPVLRTLGFREAYELMDAEGLWPGRIRREDGEHGAYWPALRPLWDVDHIVAVSEGGGACGLENLRTLCVMCHRKATAELFRQAGARRREERDREWRERKAAEEAALKPVFAVAWTDSGGRFYTRDIEKVWELLGRALEDPSLPPGFHLAIDVERRTDEWMDALPKPRQEPE